MVDDNDELAEKVMAISGQATVPIILWPDGRIEIGIDGELG